MGEEDEVNGIACEGKVEGMSEVSDGRGCRRLDGRRGKPACDPFLASSTSLLDWNFFRSTSVSSLNATSDVNCLQAELDYSSRLLAFAEDLLVG
jgi:hypothetical protein